MSVVLVIFLLFLLKEEQVREVADLIAELLDHPEDAEVLEHVKAEVAKLTKAFPVYAR